MDDNIREILNFCSKKGLLLDKDILNVFYEIDTNTAKEIIETLRIQTNSKILTKKVIENNKEKIQRILDTFADNFNIENIEKIKLKLGLSLEISKKPEIKKQENYEPTVKVVENYITPSKKLEVSDFVSYFRDRFINLSRILQEHSELDELVSINRISNDSRNISIIGMVKDKRKSKNQNIILEVEDLTGKILVLINKNKQEVYELADNISLDSVLGFKGSGNREIFFANEIIFPDATLPERKRSEKEEIVLFLGDLHFGSKLFLRKEFDRFIEYLNHPENFEEVKKIKYIFVVGDLVAGVGNYPNQEQDLAIPDLEEQFLELARYLEKIPKHIKIILSSGNHDGTRLMEPQPLLDEKFAWALYQMDNVIITTNPAFVNIGSYDGFKGFDVLAYHGFSYPYYANNIPYLVQKKAMNSPEEIMKYLLKNRHLAPAHGSTQYYPTEKDNLVIKKVPDIFVSAHTHKCGVTSYNKILIVSTSCWEAMTPYQEKFGNIPDHCKVPLLNLKTGEVKILDFE